LEDFRSQWVGKLSVESKVVQSGKAVAKCCMTGVPMGSRGDWHHTVSPKVTPRLDSRGSDVASFRMVFLGTVPNPDNAVLRCWRRGKYIILTKSVNIWKIETPGKPTSQLTLGAKLWPKNDIKEPRLEPNTSI
jgi:hypothetical protein